MGTGWTTPARVRDGATQRVQGIGTARDFWHRFTGPNGSVDELTKPSLVGCLTWYNRENFEFPDTIGGYSLWLQTASMTDAVAHHSTGVTSKDYQFAGDILDLIYLGPAQELDMAHCSVIDIYGTASNPNESDGTFNVCAEQYISALKVLTPIIFKVLIPNIPRYTSMKKKPVPTANSRVLFTGHIMDVEPANDKKAGSVVHFVVDMYSVFFLKGADGSPAVKPAIKTEGTPAQLKFNFGTPSPAGVAGRKRREISGNDDRGEGPSKKTKNDD
ncbi:hypothetical protein B0H19DRAFT_1071209 [Mycena capillaripes]|nr:hypothetical protein B0H19DRAFT_1071209 [Mycena capillaripes]